MNYSTLYAPIVLFAYKRPDELGRTLAALKANYLASQSELHIFVDGPKHPFDLPKVEAVRRIVENATGFRAIYRHYAPRNQGLATAVIRGVSQIMDHYGRAIVLEDDLVTTPNFLDYMNQALGHYQHQPRIFSVSGYTFPFKRPDNYPSEGYMYPRTGSWGWASWADRWNNIDWELGDYDQFMGDRERCEAFDFYGSDRLQMLRKWREGEIDSWAIRWCYAQAKVNGLTLYPTISKVENIGFSVESTNTHGYNRFRTLLDAGEKRTFILPDGPVHSPYYTQSFRRKFSVPVRVANRILTNALLVQRWLAS